MNQIKGISTTFCITKKVKDDVKKEFLKSNKSKGFTAKEICNSCLYKQKCPFINEKSYKKNYTKNPNFKCDKFYIKACYRTTLTTGINHLNGKIEKKTFSAETKEKSLKFIKILKNKNSKIYEENLRIDLRIYIIIEIKELQRFYLSEHLDQLYRKSNLK